MIWFIVCMTTKKKQVLLTLGDELLKDIDNYWHEKHIISRSEAIRSLIKEALKKSKKAPNKWKFAPQSLFSGIGIVFIGDLRVENTFTS